MVPLQVFNELCHVFIAPRTICHTCVANLAILKWVQKLFFIFDTSEIYVDLYCPIQNTISFILSSNILRRIGKFIWLVNFTYRYIDDVLPINDSEFEDYLGQVYPVELEIKDTIESNTSVSSVDREEFMTKVTISISISQIFRSRVVISQLRPPMASLFQSLYDMTGLAPRVNVLFWSRRDFQISFSSRDTSRNTCDRHWGSFVVDTGILSNSMKFLYHEC